MTASVPRRAVGVVGTGLIGGSVLRRFRDAGVDVVGWDPQAATRDHGRRDGYRFVDRMEDAVAGRDAVFLCGPLVSLPDTLAEVAKHTDEHCLITDVGSTKSAVAGTAARERLGRFVPGHPMAGTEKAGWAAATPTLFRGAPWVLCPEPGVALHLYRVLVALVVDVFEARVVPMPADHHDQVVALSSHIPHVLAGALAGAVARSPVHDGVLALAAGSFRDGTRVAGTPSARTADMVTENRDAVLDQLRFLRAALADIVDRLERDDRSGLVEQFEAGRAVRVDLLSRGMVAAERRFRADQEPAERAFLIDTGRRGGYLTACRIDGDSVTYRALLPG